MGASISHGADTVSMRAPNAGAVSLGAVVSLAALASFASSACGLKGNTIPAEDWTCAWDAAEGRPLADPDSPVDDAGALPSAECQATCGPPVSACARTFLDSGLAGAICPVCTF
jgi:hypothetical protein